MFVHIQKKIRSKFNKNNVSIKNADSTNYSMRTKNLGIIRMLGTSTLSGTGNRNLPSVKQSKSKSPSHFKMQIYLVHIL